MKSILETCQPREDILTGTFNPEIFTANLTEVIRHYQNKSVSIESIYTDAEQFFTAATYPTVSLRQLLGDVFSRLKGDNSRPALHRLETAFGGGKTHALIACTHVAYRGTELAAVTSEVMDADLLPKPGEIAVVGIQGDEIPVHKPKGKQLIPYTLWGEIAHQIGGDALYHEVEEVASSHAAPGRHYLDTVFGDRKVLILLDELAQYAARLEAARAGGGEQLAAFLFSLHGYARTHPGIAVVVTLAGRTDAFATQTERLATLLSEVRGEDVDEESALSMGQKAVDQVTSVAFRDTAPGLVPVQAAELSKVLAQRLLREVARDEAEVTADEYAAMYERNARLLPDEAVRADYRERIVGNYPFHPTLIDFLNNKLSTAENFQGTRGVLRVLAYAMRSLWRNRKDAPMIHACHLDLRDPATANELLGRTGSSDFLAVLNADIGGPDTDQLLGQGHSNAEEADLQNPHPQGYPMHEYAWKTVFLHSLVGREKGLSSPVFGLTEPQALFATALPDLTPPQVRQALEKIEDLEGGAFYLRHRNGRYYASVEPSTRRALSSIWHSLKSQDQRIQETLNATARKVVSGSVSTFHVEHDVSLPEHVPDNREQPILALVALDAGEIDVMQFMTTRGPGHQVRERQNLLFLLVPETVRVNDNANAPRLFASEDQAAEKALNELRDNARWALAIRELRKRPQDYGINPARVDEDEFRQRATEREKALETSVTRAYNTLWYPSASGSITKKKIKTAGGEGGASVVQRIRKVLLDNNELITEEHTDQATLTNFQQLFFQQSETPALAKLREHFLCWRNWPVLASMDVFDVIIRAGVTKGVWCIFRMKSDDSIKPEEFYGRDDQLPLGLNLREAGYCIIRPQDAKKRGWTETEKPEPKNVRAWVKQGLSEYQVATVSELRRHVEEEHGEVDEQEFSEALSALVREDALIAYQGEKDQQEKPQLYRGAAATLYVPEGNDKIVTKAEAAKRGWLIDKPDVLRLTQQEGAEILLQLLGRIGSLYNRGASTEIDDLDLTELKLPAGGTLRLSLRNVPPEALRALGELFEVLDGVVEMGPNTGGYLRIEGPADDCLFIQELKRLQEEEN